MKHPAKLTCLIRLLCALMILVMTGAVPFAASAEGFAVPSSFQHVCTPQGSVKQVTVYSAPNSSSESIGVLKKGEALEIAGGKGQYYLVRLEDRLGYIQRGQVKISARVRSEALPEAICPNLALETNIPIIYSNWLRLTGEINAEKPLDTLYAYIWDERQFQVEQAYYRELDIPSAAISASSLKNFLSLGSVKGGRKTLVIQGSANGETFVLFRSSVYICGDNREPASVTGQCTVSHSQLTDNNISTAVLFTKQRKSVSVDIPAAAQAALMTLEWKVIPDSFTVELYGAEQKLLSTETYATGFYADWISLPSEARRAVITPNGGEETALSSLRVYSETYSRHAVQQWEPTPDKLDLLLISTHQDDELLFFGGAIPYYACREDVRMDVLYMADCGRLRMREALNGLWTAGLRNYPIFLDLPDQYTNSLKEAASIWKKYDPQLRLVRAYRQYRPEVVLFQDFKGEYGHGQHQYTAQLAAEAIALAADPNYDPQSVQTYGVWQVKKAYVHLYGENQIRMDWDQIAVGDDPTVTAMFLAKEAYDKHRSQRSAFSMEHHGKLYDNTLFGLYYTAVGPDVEKNDFMENIK
jgi:LmbE family N-acetylglucosaminyl deacetylase